MTTFLLADRIMEFTTTTGTGAIALGGAVNGFRAFSAAYANGDTVTYAISNGTDWEVGEGTLSGSPVATLTRNTVLSSSNSNLAVSFSAGTKNVWIDVTAKDLNAWPVRRGGTGQDFSASSGFMKFVAGVASVVALGAGVETFFTTPSSANLAAAVTDPTGSGPLVFATAPTFVTTLTLQRNSVGGSSTAQGISANNTTAATSTVQQNGPAFTSVGFGWDTTNLISKPIEMGWFTAAQAGSGNPSGVLTMAYRQNVGGWITSNVSFDRTGTLTINKGQLGTTLTSQAMLASNPNAATAGTTRQYSPGYWWSAAGWNSLTGLSEFHEWWALLTTTTNAGTTTGSLAFYRRLNGGTSTPVVSIDSSATNGWFTASNTNATTGIDAFVTSNRAAATSGVTSVTSGRSRWTGSAWSLTGLVADTHSISAETRSVSGTTTSANWVLYRDPNDLAGTSLDLLTVSLAGVITAPVAAGGFLASGAGGFFDASRAEAANTLVRGYRAANTGAATSGNQRWSEYFEWAGAGWGTTASTSQAVNFRAYLVPIQGTVPTCELRFDASINGGSFTDHLAIVSGGGLRVPTRSTTPPTPGSGFVTYFHDTTTNKLQFVDSTGTVHPVTST